MTEGLLYVLSEPGAVEEAEFHDWYDTEHAPARLTVPGIHNGFRHRADDGLTPSWMACYDLTLDALSSPEYARLRERSPREQRVVDSLATLDRRLYELLDAHGDAPKEPAVTLCVGMSTTDEDSFHDWYLGEHIGLLHSLPGWWRTRRYRRLEGAGPDFLAVHDIIGTDLFGSVMYRRATRTPLREQIMRTVTERERRVFRFHNRVSGEAAGPASDG
ncbi:hypothetical protein [Streptomyces albidus (ex Kaewkla and Franco 2022)]|uniref:hypothetical protein n=1 Tax=Streptomyces albidus (ex Kaewkla and Franco 2022) TaxID=722709 RepID=UPI0015EE722E|nr:hypothetical protein [Streptomyces albidus (ex Kaewkla and Franco 2022)]